MLTIAADPKHLGAKIGITAVLHTWGSAMTHHPHVHMIVPGGGISPDGSKWISCRKKFFLQFSVLSRLFRRLFLEKLVKAHDDGPLNFYGEHAGLADRATLRCLPQAAAQDQLVRLRQGSVRRTRSGAGLPVALHPPRRDLEPAARQGRADVAFRYKDYRAGHRDAGRR